MLNNPFLITLDHYENMAPNTRHFIFTSDIPMPFLPGQFITLHWPLEEKLLHRNYSLANYGGYDAALPNQIELAAAYVAQGFASERLFSMQKGGKVEATGPFGRLILNDEPLVKRYILIATGTGITPYRTMLSSLAKRMQADPELHVLLLFGVRQREDVLYRQEWTAFAEQHPRFVFQVYYSKTSPLLPYEHAGRVTQALDDTFMLTPETDMAYLCGNPDMVDDVALLLLEKGLPSSHIRREKYVSPKKKK